MQLLDQMMLNHIMLLIKNKNLIASGEQGFLYLGLKEYLAPGKYVTLTPCFRNESYDLTHSKNFMKVELIHYQPKHELNSVLLEKYD